MQASTTLRSAENFSIEPMNRRKFLTSLRRRDESNLLAPPAAFAEPFSPHRFPSCRFSRNRVQYIEQMRFSRDKAEQNGAHTRQASACPSCGIILKSLRYTIWGTKQFDPNSGSYLEDDSLGKSDMEVACPNCSAKLDAEGLLF